ncbi:N,N'-diacetyllegionaminic acid synthase [subsurface metagenome]
MIYEAKKCGADAIKLQLFSKETLITQDHLLELDRGDVKLENIEKWETKELGLHNIIEQIEKFAIGNKEHIELFRYAREKQIDYASTAITKEGVDFLVEEKVDFLKVSSMDVNNPEFIEYVLSKDFATIISLGLASMSEIENVVKLIPDKQKKQVALLHTVSLYPPIDEIVNLRFINTLQNMYDLKIGYSDHTLGYSIALSAVALGANIIEKHFTLNKEMPGWDHKVSADPLEMRIICKESKRIHRALGTGKKELTSQELEKRLKFRRSLVMAKDKKKGDILRREDIVFKRPGTGLRPDELNRVIGKVLRRDINIDMTIFKSDLDID